MDRKRIVQLAVVAKGTKRVSVCVAEKLKLSLSFVCSLVALCSDKQFLARTAVCREHTLTNDLLLRTLTRLIASAFLV